jgi:hypothetical protein
MRISYKYKRSWHPHIMTELKGSYLLKKSELVN